MSNRYLYHADELHMVAAAALVSGQIILEQGKLWAVQPLRGVEIGDNFAAKKNIVMEVSKTSASTVIAAGATVGFDIATQKTVAAGAGDQDVTARKASSAADATVQIVLPS